MGQTRPCVEYGREFSDSTTLHGVRYLGERGRHWTERVFWLCTIVVCAVYCGLEVFKVWSRWQSSPVIISFSQSRSSVASIPFPAVTVCPENRVGASSSLNLSEGLSSLKDLLWGDTPFNNSEEQLLMEAISLQCWKPSETGGDLSLPSLFVPSTEHIQTLRKKVSLDTQDAFYWQVTFNGQLRYSYDAFKPILTTLGVCFSFNLQTLEHLFHLSRKEASSDPDKDYETELYDEEVLKSKSPEERPDDLYNTWDLDQGYNSTPGLKDYPRRSVLGVGPQSGFHFEIRILKRQIQEQCSSGPPDAARVYIHLPATYPDPTKDNYFPVTPYTATSVSLRPQMVSTAPELRGARYSPQVRGCNYPEDRPLALFKTYTKENCERECYNDYVRKFCNCQQIFYPLNAGGAENVTYCPRTLTQVQCGEDFARVIDETFRASVSARLSAGDEATVCGCLPACTDLSFLYSLNSAAYNPPDVDPDYTTVAKVSIFFDQASFQGTFRSELYGVTDFIASCGGLLGLFTGFSALTVVEFLYFLTLRLACRLTRADHVAGTQSNSHADSPVFITME